MNLNLAKHLNYVISLFLKCDHRGCFSREAFVDLESPDFVFPLVQHHLCMEAP